MAEIEGGNQRQFYSGHPNALRCAPVKQGVPYVKFEASELGHFLFVIVDDGLFVFRIMSFTSTKAVCLADSGLS